MTISFRRLAVLLLFLVAGLARSDDKGAADKAAWKPLFDGKTLTGWKPTAFGGEGEVVVEDGAVVLKMGNDMTGITYDKADLPKMNYELSLEGKRLQGNDFFCTTTFPVGDDHCSFVVGGWAGTVVGLSCIDGLDASENQTTHLKTFKRNQWYKVRIRVTPGHITGWVDDEKVVDAAVKGKRISVRAECEPCRPLGVATWRTTGAVKNIRIRSLTPDEVKEGAKK